MFDFLKTLFSPGPSLGIQIENSKIKIVQSQIGSRGIEVHSAISEPLSKEHDIFQMIKDIIEREKLIKDEIIGCVSSKQVCIREIELPIGNIKKVEKIIKYQVEPYIPYSVEEIVVDFIPSKNNRYFTFSLSKEELGRYLEGFKETGIEPRIITIDDISIFYLYNLIYRNSSEGATVLVHLREDAMSVEIISGGELSFIRVIPYPSDGLNTLIESINLFKLRYPELSVSEILICGDIEENDPLLNSILEDSPFQSSIWRPFDAIYHNLGELDPFSQARLTVPLSLSILPGIHKVKIPDFRKEEFTLEPMVNVWVKRLKPIIYIFIAVLFLYAVDTNYKLFLYEREYESVNQEIKRFFKESFPQIGHIIKGRELEQVKQKIAELTDRYEGVVGVRNEYKILNVLLKISNVMRELSDTEVENLIIEERSIRIDGYGGSFESIDRLERMLKDMKEFGAVKLVSAKIDPKKKMVRFSFAMKKEE